jgi:hypothetical protein
MLWITTNYETKRYKFHHDLKQIWTTSQTTNDIDFINKCCLKPPPKDNTLP